MSGCISDSLGPSASKRAKEGTAGEYQLSIDALFIVCSVLQISGVVWTTCGLFSLRECLSCLPLHYATSSTLYTATEL